MKRTQMELEEDAEFLEEEEKIPPSKVQMPILTPEEKKEARKYVPLGRALTKILRHTAVKLGLAIKPNGYVKISDIIKVPPILKFHPKMEDLEKAVKYDNKQRMQISEDREHIRAVQGHTMKVNLLL